MRRTWKRARAFSAARLGKRTVRACPLVDWRVELWTAQDDTFAGWKNIDFRTPRRKTERANSRSTTPNERPWGFQVSPGGMIFRGKAPRCGDAILYVVCSLGKVLTRWSTDE